MSIRELEQKLLAESPDKLAGLKTIIVEAESPLREETENAFAEEKSTRPGDVLDNAENMTNYLMSLLEYNPNVEAIGKLREQYIEPKMAEFLEDTSLSYTEREKLTEWVTAAIPMLYLAKTPQTLNRLKEDSSIMEELVTRRLRVISQRESGRMQELQ